MTSEPSSDFSPYQANWEKYNVDAQIQIWLREKFVKPGVNVLVYEDIFGENHMASLLPNGCIQANVDEGSIFNRLDSWIKSIHDLPAKSEANFIGNEMRRVDYKGKSLGTLMRQYRSIPGKQLAVGRGPRGRKAKIAATAHA